VKCLGLKIATIWNMY